VLLYGADGTPRLDVAIPGGAFAGSGSRGWVRNKKGTTWSYTDKSGAPVQGIAKIKLTSQSKRVANGVKVLVVGKKSTYPIAAGDEPVRVALVLGGAEALAARVCGEGAFAASECAFNAAGNALACKR
jgi:hypothetical protein